MRGVAAYGFPSSQRHEGDDTETPPYNTEAELKARWELDAVVLLVGNAIEFHLGKYMLTGTILRKGFGNYDNQYRVVVHGRYNGKTDGDSWFECWRCTPTAVQVFD